MLLKFKGNMIIEDGKSIYDFNLDSLEHKVNKAWESRDLYSIIDNVDIAMDILSIEISINGISKHKATYEICVTYNNNITLEDFQIILNDLQYEVIDLNEFITGFPGFNGITFDGNSIVEC